MLKNTIWYFFISIYTYMKKGNDKLTIAVNEKIKNLYKDYCDKKGLKIGKQIEIFMENELKKEKLLK